MTAPASIQFPAFVDHVQDRALMTAERAVYGWCLMTLDFVRYRDVVQRGVAQFCRLSPAAVSGALEQLVRSGYLDRLGAGRDAQYRLTWSRHTSPSPP